MYISGEALLTFFRAHHGECCYMTHNAVNNFYFCRVQVYITGLFAISSLNSYCEMHSSDRIRWMNDTVYFEL